MALVAAVNSGGGRLISWKEIAAYLDTSVRTVQRWEALEGLPVHRHEHSKSGRIYAFQSELDAWRQDRQAHLAREHTARTRAWIWGTAGAVALAAVAGSVALWLTHKWEPKDTPRLVHLTTVPGLKLAPSFSPDGTQVAFQWDGGMDRPTDVYVTSIGSGEPRRLTMAGGLAPSWSPDGRWIAFIRRAPAQGIAVMLIPPTGGAERTIARTLNILGGAGLAVAWSPDSRWLTVPECVEPNGPAALVEISVENGAKRQLTFPPSGGPGDGSPAWSPDGGTLAFARYTDIRVNDLYLQPLTAAHEPRGEPRRLTADARWKDQVAWTSDGHSVIYVSSAEFGRSLWRLAVSGTGKPQLLPFVEPPASHPAISRRGNRLAFAHERVDRNLWRAELSDRPKALATPAVFSPSVLDNDSPAFSPSGDRVAFVSNRSGKEEIWVCRKDGTGAFQLTSMENAIWPQWSPDGGTIAFSSNRTGETQIYAVPAAGGQPRRLTDSHSHDCKAVWSHDGKWVYFCSNREDGFQIWKRSATGGRPFRVTRHGGHAAKEAPDGKLLYYTKEHRSATGLWSVPVDGGPEVQVVESVWAEGFAPTAEGVYYMTRLGVGDRCAIDFMDAPHGSPIRLKTLDGLAVRGLSLSPDGTTLIYGSQTGLRSDLMLVEGFR